MSRYIVHEVIEHLCEDCERPLGDHEGWPHFIRKGKYYCPECALKRGIINALEWLELNGIGIYHHATYKDGVVTAYRKWGRGYTKDQDTIENMIQERERYA